MPGGSCAFRAEWSAILGRRQRPQWCCARAVPSTARPRPDHEVARWGETDAHDAHAVRSCGQGLCRHGSSVGATRAPCARSARDGGRVHSAWTFSGSVGCVCEGYRVGVVCNSDGHKGRPGACYRKLSSLARRAGSCYAPRKPRRHLGGVGAITTAPGNGCCSRQARPRAIDDLRS